MTPAEAARILAVAAIYDRRTVGELDAQAWADALDNLDPRDCAEAVRTHYRGTERWIMPSHVRVIVEGQHRNHHRNHHDQHVFRSIETAKQQAATPEQIRAIRAQYPLPECKEDSR